MAEYLVVENPAKLENEGTQVVLEKTNEKYVEDYLNQCNYAQLKKVIEGFKGPNMDLRKELMTTIENQISAKKELVNEYIANDDDDDMESGRYEQENVVDELAQ